MLLNRAIDKDWSQEGIYVSFNPGLANPAGWTSPVKILDRSDITAIPGIGAGWYPQVIGQNAGTRGTDKLGGRAARLFVNGKSIWEIIFLGPGEK